MIYAYSIMNPEKRTDGIIAYYGPKNADSTDHTIAGFLICWSGRKNVTEESVKGKDLCGRFFSSRLARNLSDDVRSNGTGSRSF